VFAAMSEVHLDPVIPTFIDAQSKKHTAVLAAVSEEQFDWAQVVVPDLAGYLGYQDWLDCRQGFQMGLAMAGVDVKTVNIVLSPFLVWCGLVEIPPSERALDAFASVVLFLQSPPTSAALAVVRQKEFEAYAGSVDAFASHDDFNHWRSHRAALREKVGKSGPRVEELPVRIGDFIEWSRCLRESTCEASLDTYATLALEFLTQGAEA
jgi:hypothetical protein